MFLQEVIAPASSPWLQPGFVLPAAITLIGGVAWLIRLEAKVNAQGKSVLKLEEHTEDAAIHFNPEAAKQAELRRSDWQRRMESDVKEIKEMVKEMAGR